MTITGFLVTTGISTGGPGDLVLDFLPTRGSGLGNPGLSLDTKLRLFARSVDVAGGKCTP